MIQIIWSNYIIILPIKVTRQIFYWCFRKHHYLHPSKCPLKFTTLRMHLYLESQKNTKNKSKFYSLKESTICEILVIKWQEYLREQVCPDVILEARGVTFFMNLFLNATIFKRALAWWRSSKVVYRSTVNAIYLCE